LISKGDIITVNARELERCLGKDDYRILKEICKGERLPELTLNRILDLFRRLFAVGLLTECSIEAVRGKPIKVILKRDTFQNAKWSIYNDEPEKPASEVHIRNAAKTLENVGITPMGA
jgi:hypothetical protein